MRVTAFIATLAATLGATSTARAQAEPGRISLVVGTEFPQWIGGGLAVGLGRGARLQSVAGAAPGPYIDLVHATVRGVSGGAAQDAALRAALQRAVTWRTHVVWKPFSRSGFELGGGFGMMALEGDVSSELALSLAGSTDRSRVPPPFALRTVLLQADAELGWSWPLSPSFALRAGLGAGVTFFADTQVMLKYGATSPEVQATLARGTDALRAWFTEWRVIPGLSLTLHWAP